MRASTALITVVVSGATVIAMPRPSTTIAGKERRPVAAADAGQREQREAAAPAIERARRSAAAARRCASTSPPAQRDSSEHDQR